MEKGWLLIPWPQNRPFIGSTEVLMSMEAFEEMHQEEQLYHELEISENEIRGGKTRSAREALSDVRENYGL